MKGSPSKLFVQSAGVCLAAFGIAVQAQQAAVPQGNADRAKDKVSMCIGCHGIPGYRTVYPEVYLVPMIAGQNAGYIVNALKAYRTGDRSHPSMRGIAKTLSDETIADLAAYYAVSGKK